tara:strand:- start:216 stop:497 length:282 start_codon:yes stop_codon:yes gene_type:complete
MRKSEKDKEKRYLSLNIYRILVTFNVMMVAVDAGFLQMHHLGCLPDRGPAEENSFLCDESNWIEHKNKPLSTSPHPILPARSRHASKRQNGHV